MQATTDPDTARRQAALEHYRRELARIIDPADLLADVVAGAGAGRVDHYLTRSRLRAVEGDRRFWRAAAIALACLAAAQALARWLP
jgi:hypothetical protein